MSDEKERERNWEQLERMREAQKAHKKVWTKGRKNGSYLRMAHRPKRHEIG